jgi:hypothetical protein
MFIPAIISATMAAETDAEWKLISTFSYTFCLGRESLPHHYIITASSSFLGSLEEGRLSSWSSVLVADVSSFRPFFLESCRKRPKERGGASFLLPSLLALY